MMSDQTTNQARTDAERLGLSPGLLELLVCPVDHASLQVEEAALRCTACGRRYPVRDGIPTMVPEDAEQ